METQKENESEKKTEETKFTRLQSRFKKEGVFKKIMIENKPIDPNQIIYFQCTLNPIFLDRGLL